MARKDNGGGGRKRVFVFAIVRTRVWGRGPNGSWQIAGLCPDLSAYIRHVGDVGKSGRQEPWGRQRNSLKHKRDDNNV